MSLLLSARRPRLPASLSRLPVSVPVSVSVSCVVTPCSSDRHSPELLPVLDSVAACTILDHYFAEEGRGAEVLKPNATIVARRRGSACPDVKLGRPLFLVICSP